MFSCFAVIVLFLHFPFQLLCFFPFPPITVEGIHIVVLDGEMNILCLLLGIHTEKLSFGVNHLSHHTVGGVVKAISGLLWNCDLQKMHKRCLDGWNSTLQKMLEGCCDDFFFFFMGQLNVISSYLFSPLSHPLFLLCLCYSKRN